MEIKPIAKLLMVKTQAKYDRRYGLEVNSE